MSSSLAYHQLAAIKEVLELADTCGAELWLRGGWAMDFVVGEITREHEDVDWFAWHQDLPGLVELLEARGWVDLAGHPPEQQRDLRRDDVELGFASLAQAPDGRLIVGGGRWAGEPWPVRMLDDAVTGQIDDVRCPVISIAAQIEIKRMMPLWMPHLQRRLKDAADIERLVQHRDRSPRNP